MSDITSITIQDTGAGAFGTLTLGGNTVTVGGANAFTLDAGATLNTTISSATAAGQVVATGAAPTVDAGTTLVDRI